MAKGYIRINITIPTELYEKVKGWKDFNLSGFVTMMLEKEVIIRKRIEDMRGRF